MATGVSGVAAFSTAGKTLRVYYKQTFTPGVAKSTITISKVTLQSDIVYGGTFFFDGRIIVNGKTVFSSSIAGSDGGVSVDCDESLISNFYNGTVTVNHYAATTISIQLKANTQGVPFFYNAYSDGFSISPGSRSITLAAIPMASAISAGAVTLGSEMTVSLTKAAAGMTDTVTWQCGTQSGTIAENSAETAFTWTPPVSLASQAPNGTSVSITLTTATKNGDTAAGSSSVTVSCPIPQDVKPTVSVTVSDETGYLAAFGSYICNQSKARVVTQAAGIYGSTVTGISVTCGTLTGSGENLLFALPNAGTVTVSVAVTDSRGRTAAAEAQIYVADYSPPVPAITALYRCDASGTAAPDGAWAKAELGCAVTSLGGQNTAACVLKYRVRGTESWTEKAVTVPGSTVFPADTGSDYQVRLCASDSFTTVTSGSSPLPAAFALLDFDRKDKALGIGQRAGTAGTLSVGLPVRMGGNRITDLGTPTENTDAATKGYVDTSVAKAAPVNLLDNSDFTNLIAQAGIGGNHGTTAYAADRWILTTGTVSYDAGTGMTLNGIITQKLENAPTVAYPYVGMVSGTASISYADGAVTITSSGGVLKWAALYEGSYTADTLPAYRPKGYGAELAECQRYYLRSYESTPKTGSSGPVMIFSAASGHAGGSVLFPTEMRVTPTVTLYNLDTGNSGVVCDWSNSADVTASASATRKGFFVRGGGKFTKGKYYGCHYEANADL